MRTDRGKAAVARLRAWVDHVRTFRRPRTRVADPVTARVRVTVLVSLVTALLAIAIVAAVAGPAVTSSPFGGLISAAVDGTRERATVELQAGAPPGGANGPADGAPSTPVPGAGTPVPDSLSAQPRGSSPAPGVIESSDGPGTAGGGGTLSIPTAQPTPLGGPTATPGGTPSTPVPTAQPSGPTSVPTQQPTASPTPALTPLPTAEPTPTPAPPDPTLSPTPEPTASPSGAPQCSDGIDNDGDGLVDLLDVLGCVGPWDNDETNAIL